MYMALVMWCGSNVRSGMTWEPVRELLACVPACRGPYGLWGPSGAWQHLRLEWHGTTRPAAWTAAIQGSLESSRTLFSRAVDDYNGLLADQRWANAVRRVYLYYYYFVFIHICARFFNQFVHIFDVTCA